LRGGGVNFLLGAAVAKAGWMIFRLIELFTSLLSAILEKSLVLHTSLDFGPLRGCNGPKSREQGRQSEAARLVPVSPV